MNGHDAPGLPELAQLVAAGGLVVLSGAGMSTDSGIPDYRGQSGRRRVSPMRIDEFTATRQGRQRYWARSFLGWDRFRAARANRAHHAVTELQRRGVLGTVITQNVDGLHQQAGTGSVIELHGSLSRVRCLACGRVASRDEVQQQLTVANPAYARWARAAADNALVIQPDGDVVVPLEVITQLGFDPPVCSVCGSDLMKPDVVFFGESVPRPRVEHCLAAVDAARGLLVLGSSLQVMSGRRFVRRAAAQGLPIGLITRGPTREDGLITVGVDGGLSETLAALLARLAQPNVAHNRRSTAVTLPNTLADCPSSGS